MTDRVSDTITPAVYSIDAGGPPQLVHLYQGGEYGLGDIVTQFQLGRLESSQREGEIVIALSAKEVRELKVLAYAYSFDYEEGFIEMCLDMQRFAAKKSLETFRFRANF